VTRSLTVRDTSTSPAPASASTREAIAEGERATDGTRRAVEAREQPVTREAGDCSTEPHDLRLCKLVMPLEQFTPPRVTQLNRSSGGVDDVREQHCGEDSVGSVSGSGAREELLHFVDDDVDVSDCEPVVGARYSDEARALDVVREVRRACA
jgi:hypothetical protein